MKINGFTATTALGLSGLMTYGLYVFGSNAEGSSFHAVATALTLIISSVTLISSMGVTFDTSRLTLVIRVVSLLSFFIGMTLLFILQAFSLSIPLLVIIMGSFLLLFTLIIYALNQSKQ